MLLTCTNKPPDVDGLERKLLKLVADLVAPAICHIINLGFSEHSSPQKK